MAKTRRLTQKEILRVSDAITGFVNQTERIERCISAFHFVPDDAEGARAVPKWPDEEHALVRQRLRQMAVESQRLADSANSILIEIWGTAE